MSSISSGLKDCVMLKHRFIYGYLLLAMILIVGVVACENTASKITVFQTENTEEHPISELEMSVGSTSLRVKGGSGLYGVKSSDENIAKVWIANDYLHIAGKKTGQVDIIIADDVNQSTTVTVDIQPKVRLFSVQDSRAEIEVEARSMDGRKAISYIENLIEGQLKTRGMYYKFIYDEQNSGHVVIYPRGLVDEFKIEGTFKSHVVDASQTMFEIEVNGLVREYNLVETKGEDDLSLRKGLFIENYSNDFTIDRVKVVKALGVEVVFYK